MFVGICLMVCSVLCFTAYSLLIQWYDLYPLDLVMSRGIFQVMIFGLILLFKGESLRVTKESLGFGILSYWSTMGFIFVIHFLPLSTGVILTRSSPAFAALFAWGFMKEPFLFINGLCIVTLFIGQLFVVQPSSVFGEASSALEDLEQCLGVVLGLLCSMSLGLLFVLGSMYQPPTDHFGFIGSILCTITGSVVAPLGQESQIFYPGEQSLPLVLLKLGGTSVVGALVTFFVVLSVGKCPPVLQSQILSLECAVSLVAQIFILKQEVNQLKIFGAIIVVSSLIGATLIDYFVKAKKEAYSNLESPH